MNKTIVILFLLISNLLFGQNLVPNPSFEDTISCSGTGNINDVALWISASVTTPDYFNVCATGNWGVPINAYGIQTARTGNAYVHVNSINNTSGWREYVQVQLTTPLTSGVNYCVAFYVMVADSSTYSINNIGAHLSINAISSTVVTELNVVPQVVNNSITSPIIQYNTWQLVLDSFVANGGEEYITIGNFNNNLSSDTTMLNGSLWASGSQLIDDVSVQPCSTVGIWESLKPIEITIYPNPTSNHFTIQDLKKPYNLNIYSSLGQLLYSENNIIESNRIVDVSNYSNGLIFIRIESEDEVYYHKILKQ